MTSKITKAEVKDRLKQHLGDQKVPRSVYGFREMHGDLLVTAVIGGRIVDYTVTARGDSALHLLAQQIAMDYRADCRTTSIN